MNTTGSLQEIATLGRSSNTPCTRTDWFRLLAGYALLPVQLISRPRRMATLARPQAVSLSLLALALALHAWPPAGALLQWDRTALSQWWRLLSGHLVHCSTDHLFWDAAVFAALGVWCERRNRRAYLFVLLASAVAIPLAILGLARDIDTYRGLSGIDTALFTLAAASAWRDARRTRQRPLMAAIGLLLVSLLAKTIFEIATGTTLFVDAATAQFTPVPLAHVVGAVIGLVAGGGLMSGDG